MENTHTTTHSDKPNDSHTPTNDEQTTPTPQDPQTTNQPNESTETPSTEAPLTLTFEQRVFAVGKKRLEKIARIEQQRPLTAREIAIRDDTKAQLFSLVVKFGMKEARKRMGKYRIDSDAYVDVQQSLAVIFFDKLDAYDPYQSTPTTYFVRYFNQMISEYILKNSQHLSQYDAHNVSLVRAAIHYYESKGIDWDEAMLANRTGLSAKVVKTTLFIATNAIRANVDDAINVQSKLPTPEDSYIRAELSDTLMREIRETLSDEDYDFFMFRMNLDGDKERSYQSVADALGLPIRDVKKRWSTIVAKLSNNGHLSSYAPNRSNAKHTVHPTVNYHSTAVEAMEKDVLADVSDIFAAIFDGDSGDSGDSSNSDASTPIQESDKSDQFNQTDE
jgi:RNA polymerase sigma factor (sigma-70 family)